MKPTTKPPTLYEINKSLDYIKSEDGRYIGIEGEEFARMVVFTNFVMGRTPVLLKGSRSSGKTNTMMVVSRYCKTPLSINKSSDKAEYHDFEKLNTSTHFIIPEINKVNDNVVEMLKDMGEGASTIYKFLDTSRMNRELTIDPKPFITSIADENRQQGRLGEELLSRLTVVNTDSSTQQNERVIAKKGQRAQNPYELQIVDEKRITEIINYVHNIPSINQYTFIYLPGKELLKVAIPPKFTDSRRDADKYIKNTQGIALFHLQDRMVLDFNGKKNVLVTPLDAWYNDVIYNEILLQSALKAGPIERRILGIVHAVKGELLSIAEIRNKILSQGMTPSHETIRKACDNLAEIGYLTRIEDQRPFKYILTENLSSSFIGNINWNKVVEDCKQAVLKQFPKEAPEYIRRYCTNPIFAIHPFSGQQVDILTYKATPSIPIEQPKTELTMQPKLVKVQTKIDPVEMLRQKIVDVLRREEELTLEELYKEVSIDLACEEEDLETQLGYLNSVNDLVYKNGKARLLE